MSQGPSLADILLHSQATDLNTRRQAEQLLAEANQRDFGGLLIALVQVLCDTTKQENVQQLAGIVIKTCLTGQSAAVQEQKTQQYQKIDPSVQGQIKMGLLHSLSLPAAVARRAGSQAITALAIICLPDKQWPELIPALMNNSTRADLSDDMKVNTIETIGFICEIINPEAISDAESSQMLTAIIFSMSADRSPALQLAATQSLSLTLEFATENMKRDQERDKIMQSIRDQCVSKINSEIRYAAFECLCKIAQFYYVYLQPYMVEFYNLSFQAIKADEEDVAMQAVEFWCTICDEEIWLERQKMIAESRGTQPDVLSVRYIEAAAPTLVPLIQEYCLLKQEDDASSGEWTISIAGGTCLGLISQCVRDAILPLVLPFVSQNIQNKDDWRRREAAVVSFGSVLDGPSSESLKGWVEQGLGIFLAMLNPTLEPKEHVRDTAAWAVGVICEHHISVVEAHLENIFTAIVVGLQDAPAVAAKNAFAIQNIARAYTDEEDDDIPSNELSKYVSVVIPRLLECANRQDAGEQSLRNDCYEAVSSLVEASAPDVRPVVLDLLKHICKRIQLACNSYGSVNKEELDNILNCACQTLMAISQKLGEEIKPFADDVIVVCMNVLRTPNPLAQGDALMIIGLIAETIEKDFAKHMNNFFPFLVAGLSNYEAYEVCKAASVVVGDICRALGADVFPFCDKFVELLLNNLKHPDLNQSVKPPSISSIGDIAHAINAQFDRYIIPVMDLLRDASGYQVPDPDDEDQIEYLNQLRESILEAYVGIIQSFEDSETQPGQKAQRLPILTPYVKGILGFIHTIARESPNNVFPQVIKGCLGVLGDLIDAIGPEVRDLIRSTPEFIHLMQNSMMNETDERIVEIAQWAFSKVVSTQ